MNLYSATDLLNSMGRAHGQLYNPEPREPNRNHRRFTHWARTLLKRA